MAVRGLLKKIERQHSLTDEEYKILLEYLDNLQASSPEAYALFYEQYASILLNSYSIFIPRFTCGRDDFFDYLARRPDLVQNCGSFLPLTEFPPELHPYLQYTFGRMVPIENCARLMVQNNIGSGLPAPRSGPAVFKYEEANPFKEQGLKTHFERLARYSFITRLQSYRYLTAKKSTSDRIEYVSPDRLGGIFTNKQKSIYYYLYLSEANELKARNACNFLNLILYDRELP